MFEEKKENMTENQEPVRKKRPYNKKKRPKEIEDEINL